MIQRKLFPKISDTMRRKNCSSCLGEILQKLEDSSPQIFNMFKISALRILLLFFFFISLDIYTSNRTFNVLTRCLRSLYNYILPIDY